MKRLFVFVVGLCLVQIVKADTRPVVVYSALSAKDGGHSMMMPVHKRDTAIASIAKPAYTGIYRNNIYRKRLDSLQKDVQLDYNEYVQSEIDNYLSLQRSDIAREIGLAKYYFPIYEKAFRDAGIPDEIKYLSIVESQLNPNAVSRVGATGPWQFMTNTAMVYGLKMDNFIDERRDPIESSYAAAAYLKDAYQQFGDWLLAIASYNCGKSNVMRAIEESGSNDFWAIRQYLPVETRGYVPSFIAITYVMNYYKKYNIIPQECNFPMKTDTVQADKFISLNSVSRVLSIDLAQLSILNPSYKRMIVNGSVESPKRLVIPQEAKEKFAAMYSTMNCDLADADVMHEYHFYDKIRQIEGRPPIHHRARRFDSLASSRRTKKNLSGLATVHAQANVTARINKS